MRTHDSNSEVGPGPPYKLALHSSLIMCITPPPLMSLKENSHLGGIISGSSTYEVTIEEPGCFPTSLTSTIVTTKQGLTLTTPTDAMTEALSPSQASPDLPSSPKWDGMPGVLNTIEKHVASEDSEDERPLSWKVRKIAS
ncbi:hypothetical protein HAX54_022404 [Datura stramonium]|uniref:Uncharacterized protein n=1 Tax=Datura stramonium TaxID=4076 RepID=A0ABS8RLB2_DATST|nr:hypothetical protein [Datura stramonium]